MGSMTTAKYILYIQGKKLKLFQEDGELVPCNGNSDYDMNKEPVGKWWDWFIDNADIYESNPLDLCILAGMRDGGVAASFAEDGKKYIEVEFLVPQTSWSTDQIEKVIRKIVGNPNEEINYLQDVKQFMLPYHKDKNVTVYGMIDSFQINVIKKSRAVRRFKPERKSAPAPATAPAAPKAETAKPKSKPVSNPIHPAKVEPSVKKAPVTASIKPAIIKPAAVKPVTVRPAEISEPAPVQTEPDTEIIMPETKVNKNLPLATPEQIAQFLEDESK